MTPKEMAAIHGLAMSLPPPWSAETFASFLVMKGVIVTGDQHSFVLGRVVLDEAEVLTLATHPNHRRQGLARTSLMAFHNDARIAGAAHVFLEVAATNIAALNLYSATGYTRTGLRRGYYRDGNSAPVDAITMSCPLDVPCPKVIG